MTSPRIDRLRAQLAPLRYLQRQVELDGDDHGPMAGRLVEDLRGDDPARWRSAREAAEQALEARRALWDGILERLPRPTRGAADR